jgi:hypothetical protein
MGGAVLQLAKINLKWWVEWTALICSTAGEGYLIVVRVKLGGVHARILVPGPSALLTIAACLLRGFDR